MRNILIMLDYILEFVLEYLIGFFGCLFLGTIVIYAYRMVQLISTKDLWIIRFRVGSGVKINLPDIIIDELPM